MMKLKLNLSKTKFMAIGFNTAAHNVSVRIDNCEIEEVSVIKYLGVMIDNQLTFGDNVDYLIKKISRKISFLGRCKKKMDTDTRLLFYKTIIVPHFDYCSTLLLLANDSQIERLQKQQNRALRIIFNEQRRAHIHTMLSTLSLLDVKQRITFNVLVLIYKARTNQLPTYLSKHFRTVRDLQPYNLRRNDLLRPPTYRTTSSQNSLLYKGSLLYNDVTFF